MSAKLGNLSADARAHIELYEDRIYGIALPRDIAKELQDASLVEWVAGNQWTGTIYGLTDAGRAALAKQERDG